MEYANKYVLIPEQKLSQHIPTGEQLSEFDGEMIKILKSTLNDHEKVQCYYEILQRKMNLEMNNPPWSSVKEQPEQVLPPAKPEESQNQEEDYTSIILNAVPENLKRQAASLLELLRANPHILKWDKQGQLSIKGHIYKDSNLADLFNFIFTNRKSTYASAVYEFLHALREMNIPKHYIKNKQLLKMDSMPIKLEKNTVKSPKRKASHPVNVQKWQSRFY